MAIKVQVPTPMRQYTEGKTTVEASGGTAPYTFTTCTGVGCFGPSIGLPFGLNLDPSTGVISGIVSASPGTWSFTLTVTDSNFVSRTKRMTFDVIGVPATLPAVEGARG